LRIAAGLGSETPCPSCRANARLLREARTNGEIFLALPAEQARRNAAKSNASLLGVLCGGGGSAEHCRGPTAAQAEFRSARGTYGRAIGLVLIWAGGLGMLLLFGFLGLRLLLSAAITAGCLLLAPAFALIPALGESGRAAFRAWVTRLLSAAVAKIGYSFLLAVVLTVTSLLLGLRGLGWWAQWLLLSAFWWTAFLRRHHIRTILPGQPSRPATVVPVPGRRLASVRRGTRTSLSAVRGLEAAAMSMGSSDEDVVDGAFGPAPSPRWPGGNAPDDIPPIPASAVPASTVPASTVPASAVPASAVPASAIPARLSAPPAAADAAQRSPAEIKPTTPPPKSSLVDAVRAMAAEWEARADRPDDGRTRSG
jgi:hypothetical protein